VIVANQMECIKADGSGDGKDIASQQVVVIVLLAVGRSSRRVATLVACDGSEPFTRELTHQFVEHLCTFWETVKKQHPNALPSATTVKGQPVRNNFSALESITAPERTDTT
jgi:hypothetical protein